MPVDSVRVMIRRIWLVAAITLLVVACGDDDDAATPTTTHAAATLPATTAASTSVASTTDPPTTATMSTTTTSTIVVTTIVGTSTPASCEQSPAFDLNGSLHDQFVSYLVGCGFTQPEAACLFAHLDFGDDAVLAGDPKAMLPAFQACNIDVDRMAEIGGA